jgi:hypothetical protein
MERLDTFYYRGEHRPVRYLETDQVKPGVVCDIYEFIGVNAFDLAIVTVSPGCSTPLKRVEETGGKTIEGIMKGYGSFYVGGESRVSLTFGFPRVNTVNFGETMQWEAGDRGLTFFEICHPPYKEGRFVNLTD